MILRKNGKITRKYDDKTGGTITFGRAFKVGILITLISCLCYVATWQILYYSVMGDFMTKYSAHMVEEVKASGASPEAVQTQVQQIERMKELYRNPFVNIAMTFIEPFPIGLIMTLMSAAVLRKRTETLKKV
jgi:hypothetical protein